MLAFSVFGALWAKFLMALSVAGLSSDRPLPKVRRSPSEIGAAAPPASAATTGSGGGGGFATGVSGASGDSRTFGGGPLGSIAAGGAVEDGTAGDAITGGGWATAGVCSAGVRRAVSVLLAG